MPHARRLRIGQAVASFCLMLGIGSPALGQAVENEAQRSTPSDTAAEPKPLAEGEESAGAEETTSDSAASDLDAEKDEHAQPEGSVGPQPAHENPPARPAKNFRTETNHLTRGDEDTEEEEEGPNESVFVLPTLTPDPSGELTRPTRLSHPALYRYARKMDVLLAEAVQDMDLNLSVSERSEVRPAQVNEDTLFELADDSSWALLPELSVEQRQLRVRLTMVAANSKLLLVRTERVHPNELEVRLMVMIRDLVQAGRGTMKEPEREPKPHFSAIKARGDGRAVLGLNSAILGGYIGYSLQRASGSDDPRLTYPLIALGTGIGLGGSMIVADEWNVGLGDSWYLSAGMLWPTLSGVLLADGYDAAESDQFAYGLAGAATGISLATLALTVRGMGSGGAVLTHSGGFYGTLLGGLGQFAVEGATNFTPTLGMGYGAGVGVLSAGILATQLQLSSSRILLIDLGIGLGALTGAAVASPLVFNEDAGEGANRAWAASVAAGGVLGALVAVWATPNDKRGATLGYDELAFTPFGGVIGQSFDAKGNSKPVPGLGIQGAF